MSYTTPPTFVAGDVLAAADLNVLGEDIEYLYGIALGTTFSGVQLRRTATQSIADSTDVPITWQTETDGFDYGGWWSSGTDIIVPAAAIPAGYTTIACHVIAGTYFGTNTTGVRRIKILVNGAEVRQRLFPAISGDQTTVDIGTYVVVAAGDVITVNVYQSSGGSLAIASTSTLVSVVRHAPVA